MKILVINAGSSSLKYQLFEMPAARVRCSGLFERIGEKQGYFRHKVYTDETTQNLEGIAFLPDHAAALEQLLQLLTGGEAPLLKNTDELGAVGHRVVHGGEKFSKTVVIDAKVMAQIRALCALAPLHNPANLKGIEVAAAMFPNASQIAVFDTAFHQSMPPKAYRMALPKAWYTEQGIRAYGFHGSSHSYVSRRAMAHLQVDDAKLISIHLGNGCSMAAIWGGRSMDTSMGLGPMGGLVMGTRAGDVDPSVIFHLLRSDFADAKTLDAALNKQSGLLGLCGYSDMRDVKQAMADGNEDAMLAYDLFAYRIRKYIGAYLAVLNGVDAIVFTAGIGENDADMRREICKDFDFIGLALDEESNVRARPTAEVVEVQAKQSKVKVLVVPTNEEREIAEQSWKLITAP